MNNSVHSRCGLPCFSAAGSGPHHPEAERSSSPRTHSKQSRSAFNLLRIIGCGCFSTIHLAMETASESPIALKLTSKAVLRHKKTAIRLLSEKTILSKIHHPLVVGFRGSFQDMKNLYLVMEFVPGGDLFRLMTRRSILTPRETLFFSSEIAAVLGFLHSLGVAYRDLKPENVLIAASGHIKLGDFGFAKQLAKGEKTYSLCGTPHCMAPEVINRSGHSFESDWWSFGILLHEMMTGDCPFDADSPYEMYVRIISQPYKPPKDAGSDTVDLLTSLLRKDPALRIGYGEVTRHAFFKDVDWSRLESVQPPYCPEVKHPFDYSHFDQYDPPQEEAGNDAADESLLEGY